MARRRAHHPDLTVSVVGILDGLRDDAELVDAAGHAAAHLGSGPLSTLLDLIGDRLWERLRQLTELNAEAGETAAANRTATPAG